MEFDKEEQGILNKLKKTDDFQLRAQLASLIRSERALIVLVVIGSLGMLITVIVSKQIETYWPFFILMIIMSLSSFRRELVWRRIVLKLQKRIEELERK